MSKPLLSNLTIAVLLAISASAALAPDAFAMRNRGGGGGIDPGGHGAAPHPSEPNPALLANPAAQRVPNFELRQRWAKSTYPEHALQWVCRWSEPNAFGARHRICDYE